MELNLHNLKKSSGSTRRGRRLGRGHGSGRGTTAGRGTKGQRARSGGRRGLKRRGVKQFLKSKPKLGGFKSLKPKLITVNIGVLEQRFKDGEIINAKKLLNAGIIKTNWPGIKILGEGQLSKKLTVVANSFSDGAKKAILDAGGQVEIKS